MSGLDEAAIRRVLDALGAPETRVVVHEVTGSTNDDARALLAEGCASGTVVVADAQRAGRGRGGNVWQSPAESNVYLSIALRARGPIAALPPFALVVGLVVAELLQDRYDVAAGIKWPNDVWIGEDKVAGVLVEALHRHASPPALIVGVGVNANQRAFPSDLRATSIARASGGEVDRDALVAHLALGITRAFIAFEASGFGGFVARIASHDVLRGRRVEVDGIAGRAAGIAADGALLVDTGAAVVPVTSGHVSLEPPPR